MALGAIAISSSVVDGYKPETLPGLPRRDQTTEKSQTDNPIPGGPEQSASDDSNPADTVETGKKTESATGEELSEEDARQVAELKRRDAEVRAHEAAHAAVGGRYAGSPSFDYAKGPDGRQYAVGGEVSIDVSPANTPEATITKMQVIRAAALAPASPSGQDRAVASAAAGIEAQARADMAQAKRDERTAAAEEKKTKEDGVGYTTGQTQKTERKGEQLDVFA